MDKEDSLISIIVPVYNVEKYLEECLESIINQTYKKIEIILINDGSTDKSLEICNRYLKKDKRIILITKSNGGLSSARNEGINISKGSYLLFVDSDDVIDKNMVLHLYNMIEDTNSDIAICNLENFSFKYGIVKYNKKKDKEFYSKDFIKEILNLNFGTFACGKLFKKQLFNKLRFLEGQYFEDIEMFYKILFDAKKVVCTRSKFYKYRQISTSIVHKMSLKKINDYIIVVENMCKAIDIKYPDLILKTNTYKSYAYIGGYILANKLYKDVANECILKLVTSIKKIDLKGCDFKMYLKLQCFRINIEFGKFIMRLLN